MSDKPTAPKSMREFFENTKQTHEWIDANSGYVFQPTFKIVDTYNKAGRAIRLLKEHNEQSTLNYEKREKAIKAFVNPGHDYPQLGYFHETDKQNYTVNDRPPFHSEKPDFSKIYKLESLKLLGKHIYSVTVTPLTFKNRVKMKLEGLYASFKQLFARKPLTPRERALKALQGNK